MLKDMRLKTVCVSISAMHEVPCKRKRKVFSFVTGKKKRTGENREEKETETQGGKVKRWLVFFMNAGLESGFNIQNSPDFNKYHDLLWKIHELKESYMQQITES